MDTSQHRTMARRSPRRSVLAVTACAIALTLSITGAVRAASAAGAASASSVPPACPDGTGRTPLYRDTSYTFAERAADLVSCMTLAEKVAQLHTNSAPAIPRLGVQQYTYWSEGQHGINTMFADTNNGGATGGVHATSFPSNFASTMTWDPSMTYAETTAISDEARGFLDKSLWGTGQNNLGPSASDYGMLTYWAPNVNLDRDPRWGRTDEAFGEDPYLVGQMAGAFVEGYQGETMNGTPMTPYLKVASTAKHYALNNNENNRNADSSNTTDANIRDYYTKQFQSLVENAHVSGIMTPTTRSTARRSPLTPTPPTSCCSAPTGSAGTPPPTAARSATSTVRAPTAGHPPGGPPTAPPGRTRRPACSFPPRRAARPTRCAPAPT